MAGSNLSSYRLPAEGSKCSRRFVKISTFCIALVAILNVSRGTVYCADASVGQSSKISRTQSSESAQTTHSQTRTVKYVDDAYARNYVDAMLQQLPEPIKAQVTKEDYERFVEHLQKARRNRKQHTPKYLLKCFGRDVLSHILRRGGDYLLRELIPIDEEADAGSSPIPDYLYGGYGYDSKNFWSNLFHFDLNNDRISGLNWSNMLNHLIPPFLPKEPYPVAPVRPNYCSCVVPCNGICIRPQIPRDPPMKPLPVEPEAPVVPAAPASPEPKPATPEAPPAPAQPEPTPVKPEEPPAAAPEPAPVTPEEPPAVVPEPAPAKPEETPAVVPEPQPAKPEAPPAPASPEPQPVTPEETPAATPGPLPSPCGCVPCCPGICINAQESKIPTIEPVKPTTVNNFDDAIDELASSLAVPPAVEEEPIKLPPTLVVEEPIVPTNIIPSGPVPDVVLPENPQQCPCVCVPQCPGSCARPQMPAHKPSKPAVVEPKDPIDELIDFEPPKPCNEDPIVPVDSVFNPAQGITNMDINQEMIEVNLHCRKILRQLCEVLPTEVLCKLPPISTIKLPLYLAIHLYDKEDADELSFGLRKQVARYLANVAADNLKTESGAPASNLEKVHHSNGLFTSIVVHWM